MALRASAGSQRPDGEDSHHERDLSQRFPIIGVGASAGGLEAFSELLKALKPDIGMAVVFIMHLDPGRESALVDLLSRVSKIPVSEVEEGTRVEPNHVYVIPPNSNMVIRQGLLRLSPRGTTRGLHMPIDCFFRSLAEDQDNRAIGIILSGSASDGTLGLKAIKAGGGITFAQDESAKYDGMPRSAIAAGCIDFVMAPNEIARELARIGRHPYVQSETPRPEETIEDKDHLQQIFSLLRRATGVDFSHYKRGTLQRRIHRRMILRKIETLKQYTEFLTGEPTEIPQLFQDLLIHVTGFFRDQETFDVMKNIVFPRLLKNREHGDSIRIWVPGCSTGEEVYSIAICLIEFLSEQGVALPVKFFATDISEPALAKARAGCYPENITAEVSVDRLRRFFTRTEEGAYQIAQSIRDACVFARHDVTKDPPFSKIDLISCRNVLIYLGPVLQRRVMPIFHYSLKPNGFLSLGSAESMGTFSDAFTQVDKQRNLFMKKETRDRPLMDFSQIAREPRDLDQPGTSVTSNTGANDIQKEADRIVLARYAPAGVLVDDDMQIVQFRGQTGQYLAPAPGAASLDLLRMAREGLLLELRTAIQAAKRDGKRVRAERVRVKTNDHFCEINLEVLPMTSARLKHRYYLILFEDVPAAIPAAKGKRTKGAPKAPVVSESRNALELQRELAATKEYLQSVIEELEASNEELRSANEEILSSNEELQSTNEELETAKEELQATNEELSTVNEEMISRNNELAQVNNDLLNLLASVNIPIVMLSSDLKIRRFTPSAQKLLNLIPTDVGRPITDIKPNIEVPNLQLLLMDVLETFATKELDVQDVEGRWYYLCIRPYRTLENKIDGAVMALIDVDAKKRNEQHLRQAVEYAQGIVETVGEGLLVLDCDLHVESANRSYYHMFRVTDKEVLRRSVFELGNGQWNIPKLQSLLVSVLERNRRFSDFEVTAEYPMIGKRTILLSGCSLDTEGKGPKRLLLMTQDLTERRQMEERAKQTERLAAIGQMVAGLAHESRNALQRTQSSLEVLRARLEDNADACSVIAQAQQAQNELHRLYEEVRQYAAPLKLDRHIEDLRVILDQTVKQVAKTLKGRRLGIEHKPGEGDTGCTVDKQAVMQAFRNVIDNAVDACGDSIEIVARWSDAELEGHPAIEVALTDNGPGFSRDTAERLFQPFFTTKTHGTGLGLAISKRLIEAHGGHIATRLDDTSGATIVITLPRVAIIGLNQTKE